MGSDFDLADAFQRLTSSASEFDIPNERDVTRGEAEQLLEDAVEAVAESSDSIADPQIFDLYCSLLKHSEVVPGTVMNKLLDSISSGLAVQLDSARKDIQNEDQHVYRTHKAPLEMYAFLLQWFVQAAEKVKDEADPSTPVPKARRGRGAKAGASRAPARSKKNEAWSWVDHVAPTLGLIARLLNQLNTQRLWTTNTEREAFINCITRPAYQIAESETFMKSVEIRTNFFKVICRAIKNHNHASTAQILLMQRLQYHEHLAEPIAECLTILAKEYDYTQLSDEILREISQKEFTAQDTKAPRIYGRLLTKFAEDSPRALLKQLSLLLTQLESDAYPMRNAVIESMGFIIFDLAAALDAGTAEDPHQFEKQIKGIYDFLLSRMLDSSSYVRTKVLAVLTRLAEIKRKFPKQRLKVTREAVGALQDKTPTVRKNAIILLVALLRTHPYYMVDGGGLSFDVFNEGYTKLKKELDEIESRAQQRVMEATNEEEEGEGETTQKKKKKKRSQADMDVDDDEQEDDEEADQDTDEDTDEDTSMDVDEEGQPAESSKSNKLKPRKSQINLEAFDDDEAIRKLTSAETEKLRLQKKYFADGLEFIRQMEGAIEVLEQMLGSKNKAEVLEAMEFFKIAHEYQLSSAEGGIRKMLHLIWNKDNNATSEDGKELKGVRARLLECYRELYFDARLDLPAKEQVNRIAKNMIQLTFDATLADLTSLEEMMRTMMEDDRVHQDVINKLWHIFSAEKLIPKYQRRGAIIILGMLALAKRSVLTDKVDVMLKVGLGALGKADLTLARYTCVALQRLAGSTKKVKGTIPQTNRIDMESPIFRKMRNFIERPCRSKEWFGLAEQAINTIYALGQQPDALCSDIIKTMTVRVFTSKKQADVPTRDPDAMDEDGISSESPSAQHGQDKGDAFELAQLLFVVGHVAIKQIAYLEVVERELKKQKDAEKAADLSNNGPQPANKDGEELDQVAGNAEDEIGDKIADVREHEMLDQDALLGVYGPMLVNICGSPQKFKNPTLRAAATLSLSKFLCVSSAFCEQHHHLLFKILDTSKNAAIRSNIVIALGDVAVSFSSIIDENSNELYKGLSDRDPIVKKNTLMVLTHLILNGMIKVKGQLGEMAKCVKDEDERIADLAKLFFEQLSTKDNAIYNNLPDIISHLSTGEHAVDEEAFHLTLKFIFGFIEKEKQAENIVEKLCQRFRLTDDPRQWRDIAFCLSLLPYKSEKSVKKIVEGLPFYRDKLYEEGVFARFQEILVKARLAKSKNDIGAELKEFEEILEEARRQGQDDQALEKRAKGKKAQAKKRKNTRRAPTKPEPERSDSEEE
ncbi:non-SMC mitotic condensation complex subunit 1-domain-containing protein [Lentinula raphanica]|uniref:Condensin complex subunit 1 n=1 Tax=Lentinula raphanica TaxID=153919 RepID=A0AA38UKL9_9AGAR|nr:non-SMC mitotic condensation complex subunit 1-domain-containing protein [Lentinula raphanica]KAJ3845202.1 non-SMC mitotic condensation complex subunit 1-domain-containing protein [Lentinula raphanica]